MSLQFSQGEGGEKLRSAQELTGSVQFTNVQKKVHESRTPILKFEILIIWDLKYWVFWDGRDRILVQNGMNCWN